MSNDATSAMAGSDNLERKRGADQPDARAALNAREVTDLFDGTWKGPYGVFPCDAVARDRYPSDWKVSVRDNGSETMYRFRLILDDSGDEPEVYMSRARAPSSEPSSRDDYELTRTLRDWLDREAESAEALRRSEQSAWIWSDAKPIEGTLAEAYLLSLGLRGPWPDVLRYHANCFHPIGSPRPALIARVVDKRGGRCLPWRMPEDQPLIAIHMMYLPYSGSSAGLSEVTEFLLGGPGSALEVVKGSPEVPAPIVVAESLLSALALASVLPRGSAQIWAALSADGMAKLQLPEIVQVGGGRADVYLPDPGRVVFAPDGGTVSRDVARRRARQARNMTWHAQTVGAPDGQTWTEALKDRKALPWKRLLRALKVDEQAKAQPDLETDPEPEPARSDVHAQQLDRLRREGLTLKRDRDIP